MATDTVLSIFADFNEPKEAPEPGPVEDDPAVPEEPVPYREEAWIDGYLTGQRALAAGRGDRTLAASLLSSLHAMEAKATEAVDTAALTLADLLIKTVIAAASEEWPAKLLGKVRMVADRVRPALAAAPEFILRDDGGTERCFASISDLSQALDDGIIGEDVTIRWQRGEATVSRTALLEDLREAVIPLSAGLVNEQNARQQT
jgi:hypothetical protein